MELSPKTIPQIERRPSKHRSRVTNGSKLLPATDGRSMTARRFKDLVEFICVDLGGVDRLSEGERQLVRRAAALSAECERQEALWARGEADFDIGAYSTLTNAVRRVFETLGLKRVPRNVTPSSAVATPAPDLSHLSDSQLRRLEDLLAEAGGGGGKEGPAMSEIPASGQPWPGNRPSEGELSFADAIERCVDKGVTERAPVAGVSYAAFAVHPRRPGNLLGLAIGHCAGEKVVVDVVREDISVDDTCAILKRYGVSEITGAEGDVHDALAHAVAGVISVLTRQWSPAGCA